MLAINRSLRAVADGPGDPEPTFHEGNSGFIGTSKASPPLLGQNCCSGSRVGCG